MAITRYIPPTKKIIDNRKPEGGYYEAECEVCGTKFYPERSNAKYCTPNCGLIAHRIAVANGTAEKRPKSNPKAKENAPGEVLTSRLSVVNWFQANEIKHHGLGIILKGLEVGESSIWQNVTITRISLAKYKVNK